MKNIVICGNVGKSAETRSTQTGDKVTSWTVAVEDRQGQEKRTLWFDCTLWGKRGESLAQYITKGGKVAVSGELSTREHDGKTYLQIRAEQVTLMGGKPEGRREERREPAPMSKGSPMDEIDEIPFIMEWRG